MGVAALITWIITAGIGFTMLFRWVSGGGLKAAQAGGRSQTSVDGAATTTATTTTKFAPGIVFGHFLLAAAGLVVWIIFLATDSGALNWIALAILVVVAGLGDLLFLRWWRGDDPTAAEQQLPKPVVYVHGLFAVTTVVLVFLRALGVGG